MLPRTLWVLVLSFVSGIESQSFPRALRFSNGTSKSDVLSEVATSRLSPSRASRSSEVSTKVSKATEILRNETMPTNAPCCFVIQDTVSEDWWQMTSYGSTIDLVNLTSYTTYITQLPNITTTRVETNVYPTNASFSYSWTVGRNPITNQINSAPTPTEVTQILTATEIVTGGITMQSPSAFYVYNTVKIITAEPVTDRRGNVYCATRSTGANGDIFSRVNSNAEAYFGGLGIVGFTGTLVGTTTTTETDTIYDNPGGPPETDTYTFTDEVYSTQYTDRDGNVVSQTSTPTGVVISLVTPFIYAPPRGTLTPDFRAACSQDSDTEKYGYIPETLIDFLASDPQYSSQYPGIESCYGGGPSIIQEQLCINPFESTTYQTAGGDLTSSTTIYVGAPGIQQDSTTTPLGGPLTGGGSFIPLSVPTTDSPPLTAPPAGPTTSLYTVPPPTTTFLGGIFPGPGGLKSLLEDNTPTSAPITFQSPTTIPLSQAPPGAVGLTSSIDGKQVLIVGPTTIPPQSPIIVITFPTTIPISQAPPGAAGSTTTINGTPFLVLQPTTITPAPAPAPSSTNEAFIIIPPTTIPISLAPVGLIGSTITINGAPYLIITSSTSLPVAQPEAQTTDSAPSFTLQTTIISGTPYLILPLPTGTSLASLSTTIINGTPYLEIPRTSTPAVGGIVTKGGTPELIITGPTTMPVDFAFPVSGQTTVVGGTTMVVVSKATTVVEDSISPSSSPSGGVVSSSSTGTEGQTGGGLKTSSSKAGAMPTRRSLLGVMGGGLVGGVAMVVL